MDLTILITIIVLALIFDYINGFHDAANSIATIVATKVLTPFQAVAWAAMFNFAAYFISKFIIGEFKIGNTIAKSVNENFITLEVILAGLIAAIIWNLLTWKLGIPSSSSHTLLGGFMGAALAKAGVLSAVVDGKEIDVINYAKVVPTFLFIFLAPLLGMIIAYFITILILNICRKANPSKADRWFKKLQLVSSALFSLGHGGNDAQKVMGIIGAAVICYKVNSNDAQYLAAESADRFKLFVNDEFWWWVPLASFVVIAAGTLSGGWKIVKQWEQKSQKLLHLKVLQQKLLSSNIIYYRTFWNSSFYNTYNYRFYYWCRNYQKNFSSTLGSYNKITLGMDFNHSSFCRFSRNNLLYN